MGRNDESRLGDTFGRVEPGEFQGHRALGRPRGSDLVRLDRKLAVRSGNLFSPRNFRRIPETSLSRTVFVQPDSLVSARSPNFLNANRKPASAASARAASGNSL